MGINNVKKVSILPCLYSFFYIYIIVLINNYRENVGYASTCNSVGQTIGAFLGYVVFITLESPTFCNKWLRFTESTEGLITLQGNYKIYY